MVSTSSGSHYLLELDGPDRSVVRLAVDEGHSYADGRRPLRRDGETLPLLGLIDPQIQVGSPACFLIGEISEDPDYTSTTRATSSVVEIRRLG